MGGWFSSHQTNNANFQQSSIPFHTPTLQWVAGTIAAIGTIAGLIYYARRYRKVNQSNLIQSVHRSRDHQRDLELANLGRTNQAFQQPPPPTLTIAQPSAPPPPPPTYQPAIQPIQMPMMFPQQPALPPQVMAPLHMPPYVPKY